MQTQIEWFSVSGFFSKFKSVTLNETERKTKKQNKDLSESVAVAGFLMSDSSLIHLNTSTFYTWPKFHVSQKTNRNIISLSESVRHIEGNTRILKRKSSFSHRELNVFDEQPKWTKVDLERAFWSNHSFSKHLRSLKPASGKSVSQSLGVVGQCGF